jgi:SAM-dependent methyltransferase
VTQNFGHDYADSYDALYGDKDYAAECEVLERVFGIYGDGVISRILDLGCGTGTHTFLIARRGYHVVGVERSPSMLAHAREKLRGGRGHGAVTFHQGDIRHVDLGQQFDAALMMFAVLGYQLENADVLDALKTARRHLRPGGLFIFDTWYGPAVLHERPSDRLKVIPLTDGKILRFASGQIDARQHVCKLIYHLWKIAGSGVVTETTETHVMRYFFLMELDLFLHVSGLKPLRFGVFPDFEKDPDETTWNCMGIAQAV